MLLTFLPRDKSLHLSCFAATFPTRRTPSPSPTCAGPDSQLLWECLHFPVCTSPQCPWTAGPLCAAAPHPEPQLFSHLPDSPACRACLSPTRRKRVLAALCLLWHSGLLLLCLPPPSPISSSENWSYTCPNGAELT